MSSPEVIPDAKLDELLAMAKQGIEHGHDMVIENPRTIRSLIEEVKAARAGRALTPLARFTRE